MGKKEVLEATVEERAESEAAEITEKTPPVSGDSAGKLRLRRIAHALPTVAIFARYALPVLATLALAVLGCFFNIGATSSGGLYNVALWRLYVNTLTGTHKYLGTELKEAKTWFYGILSGGAILCALLFLVAAFLALLALYTFIRAYRAGHESEESNRYKVAFKIAFPNRVWLFVSNLLLLIPAAFPHFMQLVGSRFLAIGTGDTIFILFNVPLAVVGGMLALTLVLALVIPRFERRRKLNMFLVWQEEERPADGEEK